MSKRARFVESGKHDHACGRMPAACSGAVRKLRKRRGCFPAMTPEPLRRSTIPNSMSLSGDMSQARADDTAVPRAGRVLFVSYDFPPCARIGAFSCAQIVRYLPSHGWDPIVLSVREQYYEMRDPRLEVPAHVIRTRVLPHPLALYQRVRASGHHDGTPESFRDTSPAPGRDARGMAAVRDAIVSLLDSPDIYAGWIPPAVIAGLHATRRFGVTRLVSS